MAIGIAALDAEVSQHAITSRPRSVVLVVRLLWALMALTGVAAVCGVVFRDDMVLAWANGNQEASQLLAQGGMVALEESSVSIPAFGPLSIVLFGVLALLTWMLAVFFAAGERWARAGLTASAVFGVFVVSVALASGLPTMFWVLAAVALAVCVALIVQLWRAETSEYLS
jgi:hypothetical protein